MFGQSWCLFYCAQRESILRWKGCHAALIATSLEGFNHSRLSLEAFGTTINQKSSDLWVAILVKINKLVYHSIYPSTSLNVVKTSNYDLELPEKVLTKLLHRLCIVSYFNTGAPLHYELCRDFCLVFANIS